MLTMDHVEAPYLANLDLPLHGLAVVIGAYKGDTVAFLRDQYRERDLRVVGYEPQLWAYKIAYEQFKDDPYVFLYPYGLWTHAQNLHLYEYQTDACSIMPLPDSRQDGQGRFEEARWALANLPNKSDLVVCNCEGAECVLVPYIANSIRSAVVFVQVHSAWCSPDEITACFPEKKLTDIGSGWVMYA